MKKCDANDDTSSPIVERKVTIVIAQEDRFALALGQAVIECWA